MHIVAIENLLSGVANASGDLKVHALTDDQEAEVLSFLAQRPIHTFGLAGFIRTNGLQSQHNRGIYYACRDEEGHLLGVALIGHATIFETNSEAVIEAIAREAIKHQDAHIVLGEEEKVKTFWHYYSEGGQSARLYCRELLFEMKWPIEARESVPELRLATRDDLDMVMPVHAQTAYEESGINPLDVDLDGFRERCGRRIGLGRTWVWVENEKLIFKADIVTDTEDVIYLEGIWVNPDERGKGIGSRCVSQLSRELLERTKSICLLVNENNSEAQQFYKKIGFNLICNYDTIFLQQIN